MKALEHGISVQDIKDWIPLWVGGITVDEEDTGNDKANDSIEEFTFEFLEYAINNLYDCKWLELVLCGHSIYSILIGKTKKTNKHHLVGYLFEFYLGGF